MPVFVYTAKDQGGNVSSGTIEADNNSGAVALLREKGLWVTDLRAAGSSRKEAPGAGPRSAQVDRSVAKRVVSPVSLKDLAIFYRQLYTLLNSGVGIYQALEMLSSPQTPNGALRKIVGELARQTLAGNRLSDSMSRYPWLFDKMQLRMIEAGEGGGLLVPVLLRLADYLEREYEIRLEIKRKTLYPKLVLVLLFFVLPINIPLTLPGYLASITRMLAWTAGLGIPLWLFLRIYATSSMGAEVLDQVKLAIPVIGGVTRKMAASRFARTLAALYGAGVPMPAAISMAGESSGNAALEKAARRMVPAIERGVPISQSFQASGFFPPMFVGMVSTGETTGNLDVMMDKAADFYEEEGAHATTQLVVTLGVVLLIIVAIFVLIKVLSFYTGLFGGIMQNVQGGAGE